MSFAVPSALDAVDGLGQHRVPEAVDRVGELGLDRRVDARVVAGALPKRLTMRLHLADELLEGQVLVLHLGDEAGGLEQPLAESQRRPRWLAASRRLGCGSSASSRGSRAIIVLMSPTRRLCSEWKTWWTAVRPMFSLTRPSPATKCGSSISSSYVAGRRRPACVARRRGPACGRRAVGGEPLRHRVVGDVVEERVAGPGAPRAPAGVPRLPSTGAAAVEDDLREAVRPAHEPPVRVGRQQRDVQHVGVGERDAEHRPRPGP